MKLEKVKPALKNEILKLVDLESIGPLRGFFKEFSEGKFSKVYSIECAESEKVYKIYGSKSLDRLLTKNLIDKYVEIHCKEIKMSTSGIKYGIPEVYTSDDVPPKEIESLKTASAILETQNLYPPSCIDFGPSPTSLPNLLERFGIKRQV